MATMTIKATEKCKHGVKTLVKAGDCENCEDRDTCPVPNSFKEFMGGGQKSELEEFWEQEGENGFLRLNVPEGKVALILLVNDELPSKPEKEDIQKLLAKGPEIQGGGFVRGCMLYYAPIPLEV